MSGSSTGDVTSLYLFLGADTVVNLFCLLFPITPLEHEYGRRDSRGCCRSHDGAVTLHLELCLAHHEVLEEISSGQLKRVSSTVERIYISPPLAPSSSSLTISPTRTRITTTTTILPSIPSKLPTLHYNGCPTRTPFLRPLPHQAR